MKENNAQFPVLGQCGPSQVMGLGKEATCVDPKLDVPGGQPIPTNKGCMSSIFSSPSSYELGKTSKANEESTNLQLMEGIQEKREVSVISEPSH